jgi:hypothetical protein
MSISASGVAGGSGDGGSTLFRRGNILKNDFSIPYTLVNKSELTI